MISKGAPVGPHHSAGNKKTCREHSSCPWSRLVHMAHIAIRLSKYNNVYGDNATVKPLTEQAFYPQPDTATQLVELVTLTHGTTALLAVVVFFAAALSATTGMAGGILMFLTMNVSIPLRPLIAIHGSVQIFNNAAQSFFLRGAIRWGMCGWFALGAVIGAAVTTVGLAKFVPEALTLGLLCAMTFYTLLRPSSLPALRLSDRNHLWLGVITGTVGIVAGAVDPILGAFLLREDLSKEEIVANKALMQLATHLTKIPAFVYLGFSFRDHLALIALFACAAVLGARFGVFLLARIKPKFFILAMKTAMWIVGLRVSYQFLIALTQS